LARSMLHPAARMVAHPREREPLPYRAGFAAGEFPKLELIVPGACARPPSNHAFPGTKNAR
jgi:hypothetical protein